MIKLCGMRRAEDISYANEFLPDHIGFILSPGFRRTVDINFAAELVKKLDSRIKKVGVFVDEDPENVKKAADMLSLDVIQLHGSEDREYIKSLNINIPLWKAVRVRTAEDIYRAEELGCDHLLLDSFVQGAVGGSGVKGDWELIKSTKISLPFFLAGGINADNLSNALSVSENVDISGGTETDGVKDREKIKRIMEIYRKEDHKHE